MAERKRRTHHAHHRKEEKRRVHHRSHYQRETRRHHHRKNIIEKIFVKEVF